MRLDVLLVDCDANLGACVEEVLAAGEDLEVVTVHACASAEIVEALGSSATPDIVVVGTASEDPLRVVQRVHSVDRDVAVVIVVEEQRWEGVHAALLTTPNIGKGVHLHRRGEVKPGATWLVEAAREHQLKQQNREQLQKANDFLDRARALI